MQKGWSLCKINPILVWGELPLVFNVLRRMNLRSEVSIQEGLFGVPINYHIFNAIDNRFKVLA